MSLHIQRDARGYLWVVETLMTSTSATLYHWYYDTDKWLKSSRGKKGDTPDTVMSAADVEWVRKHYLPKLDGEKRVRGHLALYTDGYYVIIPSDLKQHAGTYYRVVNTKTDVESVLYSWSQCMDIIALARANELKGSFN